MNTVHASGPALKVEGLTKLYGDRAAIREVSFQAGFGEVIGLIGHNGSGKSTTMNIITGYLAPTEGSVEIGGRSIVQDPSRAKAQIGFLPEVAPLYQDLTVDEQLSYACGLKGISRGERARAVEAACKQADVAGVRGRLIKNLSKGYKQRIGLAQALLGKPQLLVLDEPASGLDPKQILEMREVVRELGKEHTVLFSSHILSEITAVSDRLLVLSNGRLVADGTPEEITGRVTPPGRFYCVARGDPQAVMRAIEALPGVKGCARQADQDGAPAFLITAEPDTDITEPLFYALSGLCCPIRQLAPVKSSLEEAFLALTQDRRYEDGAQT